MCRSSAFSSSRSNSLDCASCGVSFVSVTLMGYRTELITYCPGPPKGPLEKSRLQADDAGMHRPGAFAALDCDVAECFVVEKAGPLLDSGVTLLIIS